MKAIAYMIYRNNKFDSFSFINWVSKSFKAIGYVATPLYTKPTNK